MDRFHLPFRKMARRLDARTKTALQCVSSSGFSGIPETQWPGDAWVGGMLVTVPV
jgi:hypothetical protein